MRAGSRAAVLILFLLLPAVLSCRLFEPAAGGGFPTPSPVPGTSPVPRQITTPVPPVPSGSPLVAGYYASWSVYARGYSVADIPAETLSHLIYAFAVIDESGECTPGDPRVDETSFAALRQLKETHPHLRTLISVGGSGAAGSFSRAAVDPAGRQRLAASCVAFMQQHGFDGIDVDWEFPGPEEGEAYLALLAELRAHLDAAGPRAEAGEAREAYLLTIAYGASPYQYDDIDLAQASALVDWINLMAYNYHGPWSDHTGFNAPLYPSTRDHTAGALERETFNLHTAVQAYLERGVPRTKILVGLPFYGIGWGGVPAENDGLAQPFDPAPDRTRSYDYREIASELVVPGSSYRRFWDEEARVPWLYSAEEGVMISYDDAQSLAEKADYVQEQGLGGVMLWHLAADDASASLLQAVTQALR